MTIHDCSVSSTSGSLGYGGMNFPTDSLYMVMYRMGFLKLYYSENSSTAGVLTAFTCTNDIPFHVKLVILKEGGAKLYVNGSSIPDAILTQGNFTNQKVYLSGFASSGIAYDNLVVYNTPDAPRNLAATQEDGSIFLSWDEAQSNGSVVYDYVIEYRESGMENFSIFPDGVSAGTSVIVTGLTNGDFTISEFLL